MKLEPVTKVDKKNKTTSKNIDDSVISTNCDVFVIFPVYSQFGAIRKPDYGHIICETTFLSIVTFYLTKSANRTKKAFYQKMLIYCKKMLTSTKLIWPGEGEGAVILPPSPPQKEPLKRPSRLGIIGCVVL